MNWDAIGAVSETLGALAVFVSLIYVAVQLRQANSQSRTDAVRETLTVWKEAYGRLFDTVENAALTGRGLNDFLSLSQDEKSVFHEKIIGLAMAFDMVFNMHEQRQLRSEVFETTATVFTSIMACPGAKQFWSEVIKELPPYMHVYVSGEMPDGRIVRPWNEIHDFLQPSGTGASTHESH